MVKTHSLLVAVASILVCEWASAESDYKGPPEKLHIFLLVGQSNMAGRAKMEARDKEPIERAYLLNDKSHWEVAKPPYNRYSKHRKKSYDNTGKGLNIGPSFAKGYLIANPDVSIGIVCSARGGSSIEQWSASGDLYPAALEQTRKAMKTGTMAGILWHQGESNVDRVAQYPAQLKELIERFRKDLGVKDLPFIYGQIGQWFPEKNAQAFNEMIVKQPEIIPFTACATTERLTNFDRAHFDARSQRILGKRYQVTLLKLLRKNEKQPNSP